MEISVQSNELLDALTERIGNLTVELETTRIALRKAQKAIGDLERTVDELDKQSNRVVP